MVDQKGHKSRVAELVFYLENVDKKFTMIENIGQDAKSDFLSKILTRLKRSKNISVFINPIEFGSLNPKVFRIDGNGTTIVSAAEVKSTTQLKTFVMLLLGLISILAFVWLKYPNEFRKFFA